MSISKVDFISLERANLLHPAIVADVIAILEDCAQKDIGIRITQGIRSYDEQDALYQQGRSMDGPLVTNARPGFSWHNYGLAFDFCLLLKNKEVTWNRNVDFNEDGKADWMQVVKIAKRHGFEWGGDWTTFKDYCHFQKRFDMTIDDAIKKVNADKLDENGFIYLT